MHHGEICKELCEEPGLTGWAELLCNEGSWQVQRECLTAGSSVAEEAAVQILLGLNVELRSSSSNLTGLSWAQSNEESLLRAFASRLGVHPAELRLELLEEEHSQMPLRRLQTRDVTLLTFAVRITLLLGQGASPQNLEEAAQELAAATDGDEAFLEALSTELNTASAESTSLLAVKPFFASKPVLIQTYMLPAATWLTGEWESVCAVSCAQQDFTGNLLPVETREVKCSRGKSIGCLGPAASEAGPRPPEVRACECGDLPLSQASWALPLLVAACICCGCFGGCFGYAILHKAQAPPPKKGLRRLKALDLEATYQVGEANMGDWQLPSFTSSGEGPACGMVTEESTGKRHSSNSSQSVSQMKTHVVWSVDMEEVSNYFTRQGSVLWQQRPSLQSQLSLQSSHLQQHSLQQRSIPEDSERSGECKQRPPLAEQQFEQQRNHELILASRARIGNSGVLLGAVAPQKVIAASSDSLDSETLEVSRL